MRKWPFLHHHRVRQQVVGYSYSWVKTVVHSSKVSFTSDMTRLTWHAWDGISCSDSHNPPKWGSINFQSICWVVQNSEMSFRTIWVFRNFTSSLISLLAPIKLEPWSLHISLGFPLLAIKRLRAEMKQLEVKSETSSSLYRQRDEHAYVGFHNCRFSNIAGPA